MAVHAATEFVAECLWPNVHKRDLRALDERAKEQAGMLGSGSGSVQYLGSLLMCEDEVVLCLFRGDLEEVRQVADRAGVPYDRLLETARSPWNERAEQ